MILFRGAVPYTKNKPLVILTDSQGRVYIISRGSTLIWNFILDDNVINGPDWGRSEVVFSLLPDQAALSICSPLCDHSQLTLLVNALEHIITLKTEKSIHNPLTFLYIHQFIIPIQECDHLLPQAMQIHPEHAGVGAA